MKTWRPREKEGHMKTAAEIRDAGTGQGTSEASRAWRDKEGASLGGFRGGVASSLQSCGINCLCLKAPSF